MTAPATPLQMLLIRAEHLEPIRTLLDEAERLAAAMAAQGYDACPGRMHERREEIDRELAQHAGPLMAALDTVGVLTIPAKTRADLASWTELESAAAAADEALDFKRGAKLRGDADEIAHAIVAAFAPQLGDV